jgi:hypothetical protein
MADYKPTYKAIYPLLMKNSQAYPQLVGELNFKRMTTVGDIRAKRVTPKDSHIHQIAVAQGSKTFKKYFNAAQFIQSIFQDTQGNEDIIKEVLDENEKLQDELMLFGEGTSDSTMLNNGVYWSNDPNYVLNDSEEIPAASTGYNLPGLHSKIMEIMAVCDQVDGEKVLLLYGEDTLAKFDSLYANSDQPFKKVLADVAPGWSFLRMPPEVTPDSAEGFIGINLDQIKVNYTVFPSLLAQGVNEEKMHTFHNFLMGSMMVECKVSKAIVRQPVTYHA